MNRPRINHRLAVLSARHILVLGGYNHSEGTLSHCELIDLTRSESSKMAFKKVNVNGSADETDLNVTKTRKRFDASQAKKPLKQTNQVTVVGNNRRF